VTLLDRRPFFRRRFFAIDKEIETVLFVVEQSCGDGKPIRIKPDELAQLKKWVGSEQQGKHLYDAKMELTMFFEYDTLNML